MKPKVRGEWLISLAAFRPDDVSDSEWQILSPQQRAERGTFSQYRIKYSIIWGYNEATIEGCTTLRFGDSDSITVTGTTEEFDKLMLP